MTDSQLRKLLQVFLVLLGSLAIVAGLFTILTGTSGMPGDSSATPNVESELRFYSVFWSAYGVLALLAAFRPERPLIVQGLALFLFLGGNSESARLDRARRDPIRSSSC